MKDDRERYKCECKCGNTFWATKSIVQCWGELEAGHGSCPKCKTFYNLTVDEDNKRMILTEWKKWIEMRKNGLNGDIVVSDFNNYITNTALNTITIYNKDTKDYKGSYVARLFDRGTPLKVVCLADKVEALRKIIPSQLVCFKRNEEDDPVIIETWV